ncbi:unnamed protein product [Blepharisma stoltei]|uniref:ALA-interacting subunit n=1 Tax=Blepharisma stoltei TaxID=1481888 RepID=A0AAU9IXF7_9CILI|nr:unnamed protein product [Blepharisma stoltei]
MEERKSRRPKDNALKQQRLWAYQPIHTLKSTVIVLSVSGTLFFIFGIVLYVEADQVKEYSERYDNHIGCNGTWDKPATCEIEIDIDDRMENPVYIYYQLYNFYQNYRLYVKSRSYVQLRGDSMTSTEHAKCSPIKKVKDLDLKRDVSWKNTPLSESQDANPCGLVAKSVFNDTYALYYSENTTRINISEKDIAWKSDRDYMFKRTSDYEDSEWIDVEDEHFIVWMRNAPMPTFRKLWGIIKQDLESGVYRLQIKDNYDVSRWSGEKHIVFSTANSLGGKNYFLGLVFLSAGGMCVVAIIFFCGMSMFSKKKVIDPAHLKWK